MDKPADASASEEAATASRLSWPALALFAYTLQCAGSYGIEQAVGAAGALGVVLGLVAFGALWALPQALITAELSSAFAKSGSSLYWVEAGFGPRLALVNAVCLSVGMVFDAAIWPGLLTSYASALLPALADPATAFAVQFVCVLVVCAANVAGVRVLVIVSALTLCATVTPFLLFAPAAAALGQPFDFPSVLAVPASESGGVVVFLTTILWSFQGLPNLGSLAAEVREPKRAFPRAMLLLVALIVLSYAVPVCLGVALQPDLTQWQEGFFATLLASISPWLGVMITVGSSVAMLSAGLTSTAVYSRFIAAAAAEGYLPLPLLGMQRVTRFKTPVPAIVLLCCTTLALANVSFEGLLAFDTTLNVISAFLCVASFLRLRLTQPDLPRPFEISFGSAAHKDLAAWCFALPSLLIAAASLAVTAATGGSVAVGCAATLCVIAYAAAVARERTGGCCGRWVLRVAGGEGTMPDTSETELSEGLLPAGDLVVAT
jgi:amino acid transporter